MATKICPDCGGIVSETRNDCIHCGYIFNPKPKKNIALFLLWFFVTCTLLGYLINMFISLKVGGTLLWMFEYIMHGYIAGFICMGVSVVGVIVSLCFLYKSEETKVKISRFISLILIIVILCVTFAPLVFYTPLTYKIYFDGTYLVKHCYRWHEGKIIIPSAYNDTSVTRIEDNAFAYCVNLTNVEIEEGITNLGNFYSFYGCTSLESIVIPSSVNTIGLGVFLDCDNLTSVFYKGTENDWSKITIVPENDDLLNATRYYYSESKPTATGHYWHYDENGNIDIWQ